MAQTLAIRCAALCLTVCSGVGWSAPSGKELLDALRDGDAARIRRAIRAGAPAGAVDNTGSTALMYAAVYADVASMRLLLEKGADPSYANQAGATALMWAIPDEAKVRLLIERGARVNAVSTATGRTPLLIAAGRPGASAIVRLLLEKGADPKARDKNGENAIFRSAYSWDAETLKLLIDRGADINAPSQGITPIMEADVTANGAILELLLGRGAEVNSKDPDGFTVLTSQTETRDFSLYRTLIAKGANPAVRTNTGMDLLMAAAASDKTQPEFIQELIKVGVDPKLKVANLHTEHGFGKDPEGPLDWASRHGDTPVVRLLADVTGEKPPSQEAAALPLLGAASPREAIAKALPPLLDGGREFFKMSGCTSCHHNHLPALAFSLARAKRIALDEEKARRNSLQSVAWITGNLEGFFQDVRVPGGDTTAAYLLWGLESDGHKRDRATDAVVHLLAGNQSLDGGWRVRADRPPIESGRVTPTAVAIRALRAYPIPGRKTELDNRIRRAAKWLGDYRPRTGEEKAMRLLGLVWGTADPGLIGDAAAQLASSQRPDGGWAQLDTLSSDAYATGQALYALSISGRLPPEQLRKGVRYLLDTQLADGTWLVRSRSYPLQPKYFDTGFPHGRDQWISAAATSWACAGLSLPVER
jgi:ankyrin repeat protein